MVRNHTVLYVDDEKENLNLFYNSFKRYYRILRAESAQEALELCNKEKISLIIADQRMPGVLGVDLLAQLATEFPQMMRILITGYKDMSVAVEAINHGKVHRYISKPWQRQGMRDILDHELQVHELISENARLSAELEQNARVLAERNKALELSNQKSLEANQLLQEKSDEYKNLYQKLLQEQEQNRTLRQVVEQKFSMKSIVGRSAAMQQVFQLIRDVAPMNTTVLILGESGTGKELVASAVHAESERKENPFVAVNCAALPESLLESELFGHEKGAFTGAIRQKKGRFEQAINGTIFLDEIGDISQAMQLRLLRVIEDKTFVRVGGEETIQADVRVISATNRNLQGLIREGKFRDDLYYRLNVLSILIPPLRERPEDIPLLCQRFLVRFGAVSGKNILGFSPEFMRIVLDYDWPGNVRELQNIIERAVILCKNDRITPEQLPANFFSDSSRQSNPGSLAEAEKGLIQKTLESTGWNKHLAAKILNITRSSLYSKIRRFELTPPPQGTE